MQTPLRYKTFLPPLIILVTAVFASIFYSNDFLIIMSKINSFILDTFDWIFSLVGFSLVITCAFIFLSPLGKVKIGGEHATKRLSMPRWISITICTTTAAGILFWATAEPLLHLHNPPSSLSLESGSAQAAEFSLSIMYLHWTITPFAIYAIPALAFALAFYNLGCRYSISGAFLPVLGKRYSERLSGTVDSISMFALVSGMASSLGTGALVLASGVSKVTGLANDHYLLGFLILLIVICFVASSISGLDKGIARLSSINTIIFIGIAITALTFGPTQNIIYNGSHAFVSYLSEFVTRSFSLQLSQGDNWGQQWTIFYWANWLAWAPVVALFLGKISRGHTVRSFLIVNIIIPASFSLIWMGIFSGMILDLDLASNGYYYSILIERGPGAVIYSLLDQLPLSNILTMIFIFISFLAYVTAADSNTEAIASLCINSNQDESKDAIVEKSWLKVLWGCVISLIAWSMTAFSGIEGIKMMSNLGGLPALFIVIVMNIALIVLIYNSYHMTREKSKKSLFPLDWLIGSSGYDQVSSIAKQQMLVAMSKPSVNETMLAKIQNIQDVS